MADIVEKIILDDAEFVKSMNELISLVENGGKAVRQMQKDSDKHVSQMSKGIVDENEKINGSFIKTSKSMREARTELKQAVGDYSFFGVTLRDVKGKITEFVNVLSLTKQSLINNINPTKTQADGIERLSSVLGGGRTAMVGFTKGLNIVKAAILSTGIGALVLGLSGLVAWLGKSQDGMDFMSRKTEGLKGSFAFLTKEAIGVGRAIVDSFSNGTVIKDFGELLEKNIQTRLDGFKKIFESFSSGSILGGLKKAASGIQETITGVKTSDIIGVVNGTVNAFNKFDAIEGKFQKLKNAQKDLEVQTKLNRSELTKYNQIGEDTTKSFAERESALKKAAAIEISTLSKNKALAQQELSLIREKNNLQEKTDETKQLENDSVIKIAEFTAQSLEKQTTLQNKLNALRAEQIKLIEDQRNKLQGLQDDLLNQLKERNLIGDDEARAATAANLVRNIEQQKNELISLGKALGTEVNQELELFSMLQKEILGESRKIPFIENIGKPQRAEIKKLNDEIEVLKKNGLLEGIDVSSGVKDLEAKLSKALLNPIQIPPIKLPLKLDLPDDPFPKEDQDNLWDKLKRIWEDIDWEGIGKGASAAFNSFNSLLDEATGIALERNEKLLEQKRKQIEDQEGILEKEKELFELGLANNYKTKQDEVNLLLSEEARLADEQEVIKKKAQQKQFLIDSATQAQSLITASIDIIKGFSSIPIVGLPLGIAAVAGLTAFFIKNKADAFKLTKLNQGIEVGERISDYTGAVKRHGKSDKSGQGYALIDAETGQDTGTRVSGNEYLISEMITNRHFQFLEAMKNGYISDSEIDDFMLSRRYRKSLSKKESKNTNIETKYNSSKQNQLIQFSKNGKNYAVVMDVANLTEGQVINIDSN